MLFYGDSKVRTQLAPAYNAFDNHDEIVNMRDKILYCFYDLAVAPPTYDFIPFLQLSELHRRRYQLDDICFVFVPGPKEGFRDDNLNPSSASERRAWMRNIIIPACYLLESCKQIMWLKSRDEAIFLLKRSKENIFPRLYSLDSPVGDYSHRGIIAAYARNEKIAEIKEPPEYTRMVESYLADRVTPQKLITVTVRDVDDSPARNTSYSEWRAFLRKLDPQKYKVIIIPDTSKVWQPNEMLKNFEHCELASINVLFRTALYRQAYFNMAINTGPMDLALFSKSPFLAFKPITEDAISTTSEYWLQWVGLEVGDQYPFAQRDQIIVWDDDVIECLEEGFYRFVLELEQDESLTKKEHGFRSYRQQYICYQTALNYVKEKLHSPNWSPYADPQIVNNPVQEDIDTLEAIINVFPIDVRFILGLIFQKVGKSELAIEFFNYCIKHTKNNDIKKTCQMVLTL